MEAATVDGRLRHLCALCGLPARVAGNAVPEEIFCCHACRLAARIIGSQNQGEGEQAWDLLRLSLGSLLAMNVMMISLLFYAGQVEPHTAPVLRCILLGLAGPALLILLYPLVTGGVRDMAAKRTSLDLLIAGGSITAFTVSAVNVLRGAGELYFDTATMLPVLVTFGRVIEAGAKKRAADLLRDLETLLPATALRITPQGSEEVALDLLRVGDLVRVRPGERVAVDGVIREGCTVMEEASFTGELLPRQRGPGEPVFAGAVNGAASIVVTANRTGRQVLLHRIVAMVADAWRVPSHAERFAERAARLFIPVVLVVAAGSVVVWSVQGDYVQGWLSALAVLVVACPCTIGIATPLATSLAISRAARAGILVRGGDVMERLGRTCLVFFDKTGTITTSLPQVQEVVSLDPEVEVDEVLGRLAALETASEHSLARAVAAEALRRGVAAGSVRDVAICPGLGLTGLVDWQGNARVVTAGRINYTAPLGEQAAEEEGNTIHVAWGGKNRGRVILSEAVRSDAVQTIQALHRQGIATVLLSGDGRAATAAIAGKLGIGRIEAPRMPEEKLKAIMAGRGAGRTVAMVGDGINDAPALAAADTGIAMGGSLEFVRRSGNVVILSERLLHVPWLIALSRQTGRIVRQNFAWSFTYNLVAIGAAAAGYLHPLLAALAMAASSISVLGNSMRLNNFPDPAPCDGTSAAEAP